MDIATVSVVASALVALGTLAANFIGGERQRSHEADLDFEERVWEEKSRALFAVIKECRVMIDSDDSLTDDTRQSWALYLSRRLDTLTDAQATVEAFASTRCRTELTGLVEAMRSSGVKDYLGNRVDRFEKEWFDVLKYDPNTMPTSDLLDDIKRRRRFQEWADDAKKEAVADFDPDLPDLQGRAQRLLDAARESVRRPKD
ncbi:hypothetical protein JOE61_000365 [Nocardioides salarius]|uniref:DUF4760 domain-containing protein n=1 Tax=Nocardioides salarius TaxID=374513 RepID=A0ABS2M5X0_9ACTN|nr:hypothetical protein [Nocardioides salarius]MBM7506551.1 hypothetical protein [Nocardioides salarius]